MYSSILDSIHISNIEIYLVRALRDIFGIHSCHTDYKMNLKRIFCIPYVF